MKDLIQNTVGEIAEKQTAKMKKWFDVSFNEYEAQMMPKVWDESAKPLIEYILDSKFEEYLHSTNAPAIHRARQELACEKAKLEWRMKDNLRQVQIEKQGNILAKRKKPLEDIDNLPADIAQEIVYR